MLPRVPHSSGQYLVVVVDHLTLHQLHLRLRLLLHLFVLFVSRIGSLGCREVAMSDEGINAVNVQLLRPEIRLDPLLVGKQYELLFRLLIKLLAIFRYEQNEWCE